MAAVAVALVVVAIGNDNDDDLPHDSPSSKHSADVEVVQLAREAVAASGGCRDRDSEAPLIACSMCTSSSITVNILGFPFKGIVAV